MRMLLGKKNGPSSFSVKHPSTTTKPPPLKPKYFISNQIHSFIRHVIGNLGWEALWTATHTPIPVYVAWQLCHSNSLAICQAVRVARQKVAMATFILPSWYMWLAYTKADYFRLELLLPGEKTHITSDHCPSVTVKISTTAWRWLLSETVLEMQRAWQKLHANTWFRNLVDKNQMVLHTFREDRYFPLYIFLVASSPTARNHLQ